MPENIGYTEQQINQINSALSQLSEAIDGLDDGDIKTQLMNSLTETTELASSLQTRETTDDEDADAMLDQEEETGFDFGKPKAIKKTGTKKPTFGGMTTEDDE